MGKAKLKVVVLGAGFGGLELTSILSERMGENLDLTLIDKNESFFFGFSKLDVMFGRKSAEKVKFHYSKINKPGVRFRQELIDNIDPLKRKVTTQNGVYEADILVVALGADYDIDATPGLREGGNEFYSFGGAERIRDLLPTFKKGNVIVGVTGFPFKCPPAPSEAALLLHDYLSNQGVRKNCDISVVVPFELPIPPSYGTSKALLRAFAQRNINYVPDIMVGMIDPGKKIAVLDDGTEMPFDLFLGIPEHLVPLVVEQSGMTLHEWIPVDKNNLKTKFEGVYALGDITSVGAPKAGVFAESAAKVAAESIIADYTGQEFTKAYGGDGICYVEFGQGKVARVEVDFLSGPTATGFHHKASELFFAEKEQFLTNRVARWFDYR